MAKKLILLLLLVPIIVMISLFAATKTISIMVDVPVAGITITDPGSHIYLDMDNNETHSLGYTVYPINAKNKEVSATAEAVSGKPTAELDFKVDDGKVSIVPKSIGSTKVFLTTSEGGFRASVTVHVESAKALELQSIKSSISKEELEVGDTAVITTVLNPEEPSNPLLHYVSDNEKVATVNSKGVVTALRGGTARIKIYADCNKNVFDEVVVTVKNKATATITKPNPDEFSILSTNGAFALSVPDGMVITNLDNVSLKAYEIDSDGNRKELSERVIRLTLAETVIDEKVYYEIRYEFVDESYTGKYSISASYNDGYNSFETSIDDCEKAVKEKINLEISFDAGNEAVVNVGTKPPYGFSVKPVSTADCEYSVTVDNPNVLSSYSVLSESSLVQLVTANPGVVNVTVTATLKDDSSITASATLTLYVAPTSFNITNSLLMGDGNIEDVFTLGKYEYKSQSVTDSTTLLTHENNNSLLALGYSFKGSEKADGTFGKNLTWEVLDGDNNATKYVHVNKNGVVEFIDATDSFDGMVTVRALFVGKVLGTYELRCVSNGINVYSYLDLYRATNITDSNGKYRSVILRSDVIDDFGKGVDKPYKEIETTYDKTYLENTSSSSKIKVLIEFRANVYGNGYEINADNVTQRRDIFAGPLNFVAMSSTNSGVAVSVKGQDNVCFAVYENVKVNNVTLRGSSPDESKGLDLTDLDNVGTVVEIFGDDTSIEYSRIKYGRTVIRAFGDANDAGKKINITIKNSLLSEAREFIIRAGSNCFVDGSYENPTPTLEGANGSTHLNKNNYNSSSTNREKYDASYIKTDITIENSVFRNTGLFAIGIDSHFSSKSLANGSYFVNNDLPKTSETAAGLFKTDDGTLIDSWENLSKTSYGAKIKFKGNVVLDTWKPLDDVNSSTLIEIPADEALDKLSGIPGASGFVTLARGLNFNVKEMLKKYNDALVENKKTQLVYKKDGKSYVHGGIVFFGGGKNYGVFDTTELGADTTKIPIFEVTFGDIGPEYQYLSLAAGDTPFYFAMYNSSHYGMPQLTDDQVINSAKKNNS